MDENPERIRVLVVRHGVTLWNKEGRYQGQTDIPLSDEGISQAEAVGRRLAGEPVCRVYSSDLARARMTASIIARHHDIEVKTDRRLREMYFGEWEGLTFDEIGKKWPGLRDKWLKDPVNLRPPGGESASDLISRVLKAVRDIYSDIKNITPAGPGDEPVAIRPEQQDEPVGIRPEREGKGGAGPCCVIVCHGGVIRSLIALSSSGSAESMWSRAVRQSSITTGRLGPDGLVIESWDDVAHLGG